jgi:hypothetical protein
VVGEPNVTVQRGFQLLAGSEVVALKHLFDATVEPLDHPACFWQHGGRQSVLDAEVGAERVEFLLADCGTLAKAV